MLLCWPDGWLVKTHRFKRQKAASPPRLKCLTVQLRTGRSKAISKIDDIGGGWHVDDKSIPFALHKLLQLPSMCINVATNFTLRQKTSTLNRFYSSSGTVLEVYTDPQQKKHTIIGKGCVSSMRAYLCALACGGQVDLRAFWSLMIVPFHIKHNAMQLFGPWHLLMKSATYFELVESLNRQISHQR
eukprot:scaffold68483_cov24-Prasinocladus_malaysianus.AAC.2